MKWGAATTTIDSRGEGGRSCYHQKSAALLCRSQWFPQYTSETGTKLMGVINWWTAPIQDEGEFPSWAEAKASLPHPFLVHQGQSWGPFLECFCLPFNVWYHINYLSQRLRIFTLTSNTSNSLRQTALQHIQPQSNAQCLRRCNSSLPNQWPVYTAFLKQVPVSSSHQRIQTYF